jgi:23S rRNA (cytidine1920-2'-O)/16S rRNA (cytidine1409-2'-O)-methyltransferase
VGSAGKKRIDLLLVARGLFPSREQAQRSLMAGRVFYRGERVDKPGTFVAPDGEIEIKGASCPFVSRGGLKLDGALNCFGVEPSGLVVLDAGASTGGFTQCLLERGARRVYAVDVGYGQLAWSLRQDPRVVVRERTNLRYLTPEILKTKADLVTLDLSFISLAKVLPAVRGLLTDGGSVVALVKPQFEAGRERVGKGGIVRDKTVHLAVLEQLVAKSQELGFYVKGLTYSPIKGTNGNLEFFIWLGCNENEKTVVVSPERLREVVEQAHAAMSE